MNLAVADAHSLTREGIRILVESNGVARVTDEADNAIDALSIIQKSSIDALILDLHMTHPALNGIPLLNRAMEIRPELAVIAVLSQENPLSIFLALKAGARRVICKTAEPSTWISALRSLPRSRSGIGQPSSPSTHCPLTEKEQRVLELIAQGMSISDAAIRLGCSIGTVSKHKRNVMQKLELSSNLDMHHFLKIWLGPQGGFGPGL